MPERVQRARKPRQETTNDESDSGGLAVKIGRTLARWMSHAAPVEDPPAAPRRRAPPVTPVPTKKPAGRSEAPPERLVGARREPKRPRLANPDAPVPAQPSKPGALGLTRPKSATTAATGSEGTIEAKPVQPVAPRGGERSHPNPLPAGRGDRTSPARGMVPNIPPASVGSDGRSSSSTGDDSTSPLPVRPDNPGSAAAASV